MLLKFEYKAISLKSKMSTCFWLKEFQSSILSLFKLARYHNMFGTLKLAKVAKTISKLF